MDISRKIRHEEFTKQIGNQSFPELLSICVSPLVLLLIRNVLIIRFGLRLRNFFTNFLFDLLCLICPLILLLTVAANHALSAISSCAVLTLGWIGYKLLLSRKTNIAAVFNVVDVVQLPDLTTTVLVLSCLMILIIDFPICPRRFAKTTLFGLGLMDVGTGLFICISGKSGTYVLFHAQGYRGFWNRVFRSVVPCFLLGSFRLCTVSLLGYQSVVDEYGIHWNFFFSVALIRLVSALVCNKWIYDMSKHVRIAVAFAISFMCLSISHYIHNKVEFNLRTDQSWPSSEARANSLVMANIEGLLSLPGYLSIYFFTLACFAVIRYNETGSPNTSSVKCFVIVTALLILFTGCGIYLLGLANVSRRFANPAYVMCIILIASVSAVLSWLFRVLVSSVATHAKAPDQYPPPSAVCHAVSSYGMCYFLICNLCTGIVNLCCDTLSFLPPDALVDPRTGAYPMNLWTVWPQLAIIFAYATVTLGLTALCSLRHGVPDQFN